MLKKKIAKLVAALVVITTSVFAFAACNGEGAYAHPYYKIVGNEVFNQKGEPADIDCKFFSIGGKTYYAVDNRIVTGMQVIDRKIYNLGNDGIVKNDRIYNREFVLINGNTYYAINNEVAIKQCVIDGRELYFDTNGIMREAADGFIDVGDKTYYIKDNNIVLNYFPVQITDGETVVEKFYDFGTDGALVSDDVNGVIEYEGNEYYLIHGIVSEQPTDNQE